MKWSVILMIIMTGIAISADYFSVAVSDKSYMEKKNIKDALLLGFIFAVVQLIMLLAGFFAAFYLINMEFIKNFYHWIVFAIFCFIGLNMIRDVYENSKLPEYKMDKKINLKDIFSQAFEKGINVLVVGIAFSLLNDVNIIIAAAVIFVFTFILSVIGFCKGKSSEKKLKNISEVFGGIIFIITGIEILAEYFLL